MRNDPWTDQWADPQPDAYGEEPVAPEPDPWFPHFLRYLGLYFLVLVGNIFFLAGFVIVALLMDKTGRRKRDVLGMLVPILNAVWVVQTVWRATARNMYWSPRHDRPSEPLQGSIRPVAIAVGWIVGASLIVTAAIGIATGGLGGWTSYDKAEFKRGIQGDGVDATTAQCVVDFYVNRFPDGPDDIPDEDDPAFTTTAQEAFSQCGE